MNWLWRRYKELGGILHGPDPYGDETEENS